MNVKVSKCDAKLARVQISGDKVKIKVNQHWDERLQWDAINRGRKIAQAVIDRGIKQTMSADFNPEELKGVIEVKSSHKTSPKILQITA